MAVEHATIPKNHGVLPQSNGFAEITGPCGDTMWFWLYVADGIVQDVSFMTDGCCSSLACGSMATTLAKGRNIKDIVAINQKCILDALGKFPSEFKHCALLAANTLRAAYQDYINNSAES